MELRLSRDKSYRWINSLNDTKAKLAKLTRETLNKKINAVVANPDKSQDMNELRTLVLQGLLSFDSFKLMPNNENSRYILGIVIAGDENKALLVFEPEPICELFLCYHPYQDSERYLCITINDLLDKIQQAIASCDETIEKIKEGIKIEAPDRRSAQREHITNLIHHLADIRTLSMMGKLELSDEMISRIATLDHLISNMLEAYSKGQTLEPPEAEIQ